MKLGWLLLACAVCWGWQRPAAACSVILPEKQSVECAPAGDAGAAARTSVASARLELDAIEVKRSLYPPPGLGDCGELGSTRLRFHLSGASAWPPDVGILLTLREGRSGYFAPPPTQVADVSGWLLLTQDGSVRLFGPDDPREPLALRLEARAVDCQGALSAPVDVNITHPGRRDAGAAEPDATPPLTAVPESAASAGGVDAAKASRVTRSGGSCAVCAVQSAAPQHGAGGLPLALGVLALALRRRVSRGRDPRP